MSSTVNGVPPHLVLPRQRERRRGVKAKSAQEIEQSYQANHRRLRHIRPAAGLLLLALMILVMAALLGS